MDLQEEVIVVEKELVEVIIKHLRQNKIQVDEAQKLAKEFLTLLPFQDQKDLLQKLKSLGSEYDEVQEVYLQELGKASEQQEHDALSQMRSAIKQGNIEQAISVAKSIQGENK